MKFVIVESAEVNAIPFPAALCQSIDTREKVETVLEPVCQDLNMAQVCNIETRFHRHSSGNINVPSKGVRAVRRIAADVTTPSAPVPVMTVAAPDECSNRDHLYPFAGRGCKTFGRGSGQQASGRNAARAKKSPVLARYQYGMNAKVGIVPPPADGLIRFIFEAVFSETSPRIINRHLQEQVIHAYSGLPDFHIHHGHLG